jgi:hypothetical protein
LHLQVDLHPLPQREKPEVKVFLETNTNGTSSWNNSKMFGLVMPQIYGEVAYNNMSVKIGHF